MVEKEIIKKIREIEIKTKKLVNESMAGEYHSVFKGQGIEYDEVREYQVGDDIRSIDWNVSSRHGNLFVKKYVEERELTVLLLIDISGSLRFGSNFKTKQELAAEIGAILSFSAIKNNDRVGLLLFSDRIEKFIPPRKGRKHVLRIIREILTPQGMSSNTDISKALDFISSVVKKRAIVFLISDFFDSNYENKIKVVSKRNDLVAITINDPLEFNFPEGLRGYFEGIEWEDDFTFYSSSKKKKATYSKVSEDFREKRDRIFKKYKIDCIELLTNEDYEKKLISFFKMRMRRFR